jgi:hopanoid biosynthesis associated protein HpnK
MVRELPFATLTAVAWHTDCSRVGRDTIPLCATVPSLTVKTLILNADDFGLTRGVNEGIIRAHREGILTSATLMATGPAFEDAVERARATPTLGVGCHLVLTGGVAIAPREEILSLVDREGRLPRSLGEFVAKLSSGRIRTQEIEVELRAQIEKIRRAGIEPTHCDTHKHTHAHPAVMKVLGRLMQELEMPRVRKPVEDLRDSWVSSRGLSGTPRRIVSAAAVRSVAFRFRAISKRYGLRSPDHFLGLAATGELGPALLCRLVGLVREGSTEIMLHPGICDADLRGTGSRLQAERQNEMEGLLAPEVRRAVDEHGIRLATYRELT